MAKGLVEVHEARIRTNEQMDMLGDQGKGLDTTGEGSVRVKDVEQKGVLYGTKYQRRKTVRAASNVRKAGRLPVASARVSENIQVEKGTVR